MIDDVYILQRGREIFDRLLCRVAVRYDSLQGRQQLRDVGFLQFDLPFSERLLVERAAVKR